MSSDGQRQLGEAIQRTINYHAREFDLSYAEILGVLYLISFQLACDACSDGDSDEAEEADDSPEQS